VSAASHFSPTESAGLDQPFRVLVDSVIDYGIFMLDAQGRVRTWNAGAEQIQGYRADEIVGQHVSLFYPPEDVAEGKCDEELRIARDKGRFEQEGWRIRKDGARFWANAVITPIRDHNRTLIGYAKVTRDLTERRKAEEELKTTEDRLRLLIASVKDYAIFVLDPSGNVATWNPGAERLKGYSADEIIGRHFSTFYPREDVDAGKCEMELEGARAAGRFEDEGWRLRKDGTRFWANVIITPLREADGTLVGYAKVTRDLSERKRHEEERVVLARAEAARRVAEENEDRARTLAEDLRRARDRAEEAGRLKDEFLATVSHELRTPLSAILGWARMLQSGALEPAKVASAIDAIVRNAIAQQQIVDDLLDVSRIVSGQLRLDIDFIDIGHVVTAAAESIRAATDAKGLTLQVSINPEAGVIKGDSGRLQQVMWNLLSNAVKFTPRGGTICLALSRVNSAVEVRVSDNGRGISKEFLPHVFERFAQQDGGNTRRAGGLGLGLAIVKHLVELHGGVIEAHSDGPGAGAEFVVRLPVAAVRGSSALSTGRTHEGMADAISFPTELKGLKILVVDDEADARQLLQSVLEQGGAVVDTASSAEAALQRIRAAKPDVIISDVGMPDVDGYEFIQRLRQMSRDEGGRIPAVALTAYARAEDRRKALMAGFQNHAAKPMDPQELVVVVANLVGRYA
jgi:PAS domain S-box-containing protein